MLPTHIFLILKGRSTVESFQSSAQLKAEQSMLENEFQSKCMTADMRRVRRQWEAEYGGVAVNDRWAFGRKRDMWRREMGTSWVGWLFLFLIGHVLGWGLNPDRHLQLARLDEAAVDQFNRVLAERTGNEDCQVVTLVHLRGEGGRLTEMERTNARQPCPQECSRWAPAAAESAMDITRALQSQCLSPQDWTTFNGYLSDATSRILASRAARHSRGSSARPFNPSTLQLRQSSFQVSSDVEAFVEALYLNSVSLLGSSAKDVSEVAHAQLELQTMSKNTADLSPQIIQALENTKMLSALQSSMAHSLMLAENAKVSLERLNTSITSFVNAVTAPWTIIPVWSVLRAVFAMGPNILRAAWTVICSVSTSTSFETVCARPASILKRQVPLLFLGRWLLNIALRQLRRTKSYRNVTLQRAGFPVARHPIQELERRVQLGRRAFSEAL
ncbi:vacuole protein [Trichosporon asahii var. asahii CBS 2479]|uniref:Vacuole protein n=1 Tax=Trichosporon asahii var. asahii (strain ATCC 90039 / CBS 2479 / JCM 2466 / KCTC 7840 / NBRC 103889/ NCYC 2677 / UAMH 7654) TaxID=1186058 RepID=J5R4J1_TRIAS|nr:vacuole protein [Trichosporon asahii var. asahii CBS 2479]EJT50663.1 vacuole protein [Trichosporon asahii var. asahii CBS 2479]